MIFRQSKQEEIESLFREGFKVWNKDRTFEQYCSANSKEDAYGTRYILEDKGEIVSSLILLELKNIGDKKVYGIGSVLTSPACKNRGYATELLKNCIQQINIRDALVFLYSEVAPAFYERFGFRTLPPGLQRETDSICMVLCDDDMWSLLINNGMELIPVHF